MAKSKKKFHVRRSKKISNEILCQMIQAHPNDCQSAKSMLLQQNEGMIHVIAKQERRRYAYLTLEMEDLYQAGRIGALHAAERFQPENGTAFTTFAWMHIRQSIQREMIGGGTMIRFPAYLHERMHRFSVYRVSYGDENVLSLASAVSESESAESKTKPEEVKKFLNQIRSLTLVDSLNEPTSQDGVIERQDLIADLQNLQPDEIVEAKVLTETCLTCLTERERTIIVMRYGLKDSDQFTLDEIGKKLHLSKERVRQLEHKAMQKMKEFCRFK